ncbi:MAG: ABC transporter permease [Massilibacteroides sp.]|nr:ABC transporter permease [Massilibacteroides sp.]MDD3063021.1 ABC transporter permease [Massilibacteroides sp.]MDD4114202.1 ABC transporter permease [Massilibacteroides sp.]MDD4660530.1 ABC transporter permease [Massilibacteroides sp.]
MFNFENTREIWSTIKKNKLRTFLTGFSVAWGIFMLIVLLGASNGLRNGIMHNFRNMSMNKVEVWGRYTTMPYKGLPTNRRIQLTEEDYEAIKREHPEIELRSATVSRSDTISFGEEYVNGSINAVFPDHAQINYVNVNAGNGRFVNNPDIRGKRKVIVISPRMAEVLFRDLSPLGQYVKVGHTMYQVVGVYNDEDKSNDAPAYIPFSTGQMLYNKGYGINELTFTLKGIVTEEENEAFEERFRASMGRRHQFDPADKNAIGMWNTANQFRMLNGMMNGITFFIWIVGIGTLMAGIVGVSNIMLITVRERTREFGIRKAIGAKPSSILGLIIAESIMVTAVFGYVGMLGGIGITEAINYGMEMAQATAQTGGNPGENTSVFRDPTVSLGISLSATILIIIAGVLAGYFPARKAVKVSAVEAMRHE